MIRTANLLSGAAVKDLSSVNCLMNIWKRHIPYNQYRFWVDIEDMHKYNIFERVLFIVMKGALSWQ